MIIYKWDIYCNTEGETISGYLDSEHGNPPVCFNNNAHSIDTSKSKIIETIEADYTQEVCKWKIFCDTEQIYTYGYSNVVPYPETCFNNVEHIVSMKPELLARIKNNYQQTTIVEEQQGVEVTDGRFRCDGFEVVAASNTTTKKNFSWPYPISALILRFITEETHRGDYINCYGKPTTHLNNLSADISASTSVLPVNSTTPFVVGMTIVITDSINTENLGAITSISTENSTITTTTATGFSYYKNAYLSYFNPVGTITAGVTAGDVVMTCNSTVMENVKKGMVLYINDSTNSERLGEVFEVNTVDNTITIQNSPANSYSSGSYITASLHMIKNYKIGPPGEHTIGTGKIGGSYVSKLHVISIEYTNNSPSTTKDFNWYTEVLY